jgi:NarL family two-component system response regulator LiaR
MAAHVNESEQPIRVLIADDHEMVRSGLAAFLRVAQDLELAGEAASGAEAVRQCLALQPDVVLMDMVMPGLDGVAATRLVRERCPDVQVIALTSFVHDDLVHRALDAGALSYLMKNVGPADLAAAIRAAARSRRRTLAPEASQALIRRATARPALGHDLSAREREVLSLMVSGRSNRQIAAQLIIGRSTVDFHVSNILGKLGAGTRTEAVALALKHKMTC